MQRLILILCMRGCRQAEVQDASKHIASTICKGAILCNLETVQLYDSQVLVIAHLHTPQEGFHHFLLEDRLRNMTCPVQPLIASTLEL